MFTILILSLIAGKEGFMMLGYDDIYSIEYMYEKRMGYWKHDGKVTIFDAFEKLRDNYQAIMERCRAFDELIYDDAERQAAKICRNLFGILSPSDLCS